MYNTYNNEFCKTINIISYVTTVLVICKHFARKGNLFYKFMSHKEFIMNDVLLIDDSVCIATFYAEINIFCMK